MSTGFSNTSASTLEANSTLRIRVAATGKILHEPDLAGLRFDGHKLAGDLSIRLNSDGWLSDKSAGPSPISTLT